MTFSTINRLKYAFAQQGCNEILIKPLALNQDNEKNQIYLGHSNELFSIIPGTVAFRGASESTSKNASVVGRSIIENSITLLWLNEGKEPSLAPNARIIDYFQYPEMRLSGFLSGCKNPPDSLRRDHQDAYGQRVLVLGISEEKVFATVISQKEDSFVAHLLSQPEWPAHPLFRSMQLAPVEPAEETQVSEYARTLVNAITIDPKKLLEELRKIGGYKHPSTVLKSVGEPLMPFRGTQGAGWTLESILGIPRNSSGNPDKYGFELKTYLSTKITLMTPEPNFGVRYEKGLKTFLKEFGWVGAKNDGSLRFNGKHSTVNVYKKSGLKLELEHWNYESNSPDGKGSPNVLLINPLTKEIAAGWTFEKLAEKWGRKHAGAMFVQANKFIQDEGTLPSHYSYGPDAYCGLGTSPLHLMKSIALGLVYLDPGDRINAAGEEKKRTQWRITKGRGRTFGQTLAPLYDEMTQYEIS